MFHKVITFFDNIHFTRDITDNKVKKKYSLNTFLEWGTFGLHTKNNAHAKFQVPLCQTVGA